MSANDAATRRHAPPEAEALAKLRLLLGILADSDCARRGMVSSVEELEETARWYRARFNLLRRRELERFLASAQLSEAEFVEHMKTFSNIAIAQRVHGEAVDRRMPQYQMVFSVRDWLLRRESRPEKQP